MDISRILSINISRYLSGRIFGMKLSPILLRRFLRRLYEDKHRVLLENTLPAVP
jgi:hypothetical protein